MMSDAITWGDLFFGGIAVWVALIVGPALILAVVAPILWLGDRKAERNKPVRSWIDDNDEA
ncbi:MAG: hypothetical protein ACYTEQ_19695 [Planctomycetota bacterium]|jgi:hypothetical protein